MKANTAVGSLCCVTLLLAAQVPAGTVPPAAKPPSAWIERVSERTAFFRFEAAPTLRLQVKNVEATPWRGARLALGLREQPMRAVPLPELAPGATHEVRWAVDTQLRPDRYTLVARLTLPGPPAVQWESQFPLTLVPRRLPHVMPVLMWGGPTNAEERRWLKELGFTHYLLTLGDHARIWKAGQPGPAAAPNVLRQHAEQLDAALAEQFYVYGYVFPGRWARSQLEYQRVGRDGKPYPVASKYRDICALDPAMQRLCRDVGASIARSYGQFPALQGFDIHSETRDAARPCFHAVDREAFRRSAGVDIPAAVGEKGGTNYKLLADFPADRVIADDDPRYVYYRWFWKQGDGWVQLNDAVDEGLKSTGRSDWFTYYGPATRVPSVLGGGGRLDALNNWTYVYPDPLGIGLNIDELWAVARGARRPQAVTMGIQIICYRSVLAPRAAQGPRPAAGAWDDFDPEAAYVTVPPMCLREGFWAEISRPVQGLVHHGFESLFPTGRPNVYRYTHAETRHELRRLLADVVRPLGPTLLQVPDPPADVAFLESFAAQVFAGRGTYGWSRGWEGAAYRALQYAQLQPQVFYEETLLQRGLDGVRVLVAPNCDVLPRSVVEKIRAFQSRGGILVGDERLCPALHADINLEVVDRVPGKNTKADEDKAAVLRCAAGLRRALDRRYQRVFEASNPEVITRRRCFGAADYLFVVNDRREFGDYVGRYGTTMENGLPSQAMLTLRRRGGAVYDLVAHRPVAVKATAGALRFPVELGPCEGRVLLVLPRPLAGLKVRAPERVARAGNAALEVAVTDADGQTPDAVIPLAIEIRDPEGRVAEFSGYYGARRGTLQIKCNVAANDVRGVWTVHAQELASGMTSVAYFRVGD
jgi:hypothetical protein